MRVEGEEEGEEEEKDYELSLFRRRPSHARFFQPPLPLSLTCRRRRNVHRSLHPGPHASPLGGRARPLPVVDVAGQHQVDRVLKEDRLERACEVCRLFKLRGLGEVGVEGAVFMLLCCCFGWLVCFEKR